MRAVATALITIALGGCGTAEGAWPSLAVRPGQAPSPDCAGIAAVNLEPETAAPSPLATLDLPPISAARVHGFARQLDMVQEAYEEQADAVRAAIAADAGSAQVELSRLDVVFGRIAPIEIEAYRLAHPYRRAGAFDALPAELKALLLELELFRKAHMERYGAFMRALGAAAPDDIARLAPRFARCASPMG